MGYLTHLLLICINYYLKVIVRKWDCLKEQSFIPAYQCYKLIVVFIFFLDNSPIRNFTLSKNHSHFV